MAEERVAQCDGIKLVPPVADNVKHREAAVTGWGSEP
jgi:hypothetical protein